MFKTFPRHTVQCSGNLLAVALKAFLSSFGNKSDYAAEFENAFAEYAGAKYAFAVSSGRTALSLILDALSFEKGTEVIISDYNFPPVPMILKHYGIRPVFIDICPRTHNIDASLIERKITPRTGAILVTHLFGQPCEMDIILEIAAENGIKVIEDCAHSCGGEYKGRKTGTFGDVSYFSFGHGKNLPCFGGGMILTSDEEIYGKLKLLYDRLFPLPAFKLYKNMEKTVVFYLATHKLAFPYVLYPVIYLLDLLNSDLIDSLLEEPVDAGSISFGDKYKMAGLQAKAGLMQLGDLEKNNEKRISNAELLNSELKGMDEIRLVENIVDARNIYLYYRIMTEDRQDLRKKLLKRGIDTKKDDMRPCSLLSFFDNDKETCPVSREISNKCFEIPCNSFLSKEDIFYIAKQIKDSGRANR